MSSYTVLDVRIASSWICCAELVLTKTEFLMINQIPRMYNLIVWEGFFFLTSRRFMIFSITLSFSPNMNKKSLRVTLRSMVSEKDFALSFILSR